MAKLTNFTDMSKLATSLAFNKPVTGVQQTRHTAEVQLTHGGRNHGGG